MKEPERQQMESSIIGCVLLDPQRCLPLAINEGIESDWFTNQTKALAWFTIRSLWTERVGVDALTVIERARRIAAEHNSPFKGYDADIVNAVQSAIDDTPTTAHFEHYVTLGRHEVMFRRVEKAHHDFAKEIQTGGDVDFATQNFNRRRRFRFMIS